MGFFSFSLYWDFFCSCDEKCLNCMSYMALFFQVCAKHWAIKFLVQLRRLFTFFVDFFSTIKIFSSMWFRSQRQIGVWQRSATKKLKYIQVQRCTQTSDVLKQKRTKWTALLKRDSNSYFFFVQFWTVFCFVFEHMHIFHRLCI